MWWAFKQQKKAIKKLNNNLLLSIFFTKLEHSSVLLNHFILFLEHFWNTNFVKQTEKSK